MTSTRPAACPHEQGATIKAATIIPTALVALTLTGNANAAQPGSSRALTHARHVIAFFDRHPQLLSRQDGRRALFAAIGVIDHAAHLKQARKHREKAALLANRSWEAAVNYTGRYFGRDIAAWEWECSSGEGGHGGFVWNMGGSGAFGPLQFISSTFWGIIDRGIANARGRGMVVPAAARAWDSYLGQAIAGAQMIMEGRVREWTAPACH
ncbi:hypothetical protein UFOVP1574_23 [uncultured Caudovirales phage]|uniref:Uncharacterized protein n=2 Tax=uncultured Caudovirales phage TaxID=2100421 RepID=A0A6J5RFG8_9CAUD|nr:hypothetical protein UFOVP959_23 [uncultured Caudovirales phage]CAB4192311.1 hypothetical protein UFOVP1234_18 [uncultured Caudovirales phage]CAB4215609.1 hypothetical protein UFOVP1487_31 [uncultured Caudovirales phage]CAB5238931.1 hypothetical protein UFOVP1574_23 [uncultured Caudovirales phage]